MSYFEPVSEDFYLDVARGLKPGITHINKFGEVKSSTINLEIPIWDGGINGLAYPYPLTATITHVSTAVNDIPMLGAQINVQGLDATWNLVNQTVLLDATLTTTAVALTTPLIRIFRMKVEANVKTLQLVQAHDLLKANIFAQIGIGYNQTLMAMFTVPAGVTAFMTNYYGDVLENIVLGKDPDATEFYIWAADRLNGYEFQIKHERGIPKGAGGFVHNFKPYVKFTERTDILMATECSGQPGHIHAGFDLILVDN